MGIFLHCKIVNVLESSKARHYKAMCLHQAFFQLLLSFSKTAHQN